MKNFQDFQKGIDAEILAKWDREIRETLIPKLDKEFKDDPAIWSSAFNQSYALQVCMRLLEAYHAWLND